MTGVDHGDHRFKLDTITNVRIGEESLKDWSRVGKSGGFDNQALQPVSVTLQKLIDAGHQIRADRTADASIIDLNDGVLFGYDQLTVDADLAIFIDHDADLHRSRRSEDVVHQSRFACAQESGDNSRGYLRESHRFNPVAPSDALGRRAINSDFRAEYLVMAALRLLLAEIAGDDCRICRKGKIQTASGRADP
jgi:hypothetical protein